MEVSHDRYLRDQGANCLPQTYVPYAPPFCNMEVLNTLSFNLWDADLQNFPMSRQPIRKE